MAESEDKPIFIQMSFSAWKSGWPGLTIDDLDSVAQAMAEVLFDLGFNSEGTWLLSNDAPISRVNKPGAKNGQT